MRSPKALLLFAFACSLPAQVSFDRILAAGKEPQNWLTYSGTLSSQRYSTLDQITPANVKDLELQWVFQAQSLEKFEATALVVDGIMYTVQAPNDVIAIDALTGRVLWIYRYAPSRDARPCCGRVNRGLAILGDTLFMGTIDALCDHARPARGERQDHYRNGGRRIRNSGVHRGVRCRDREGRLALLHDSRSRRTRP
jgi:glucose dehydrogenase